MVLLPRGATMCVELTHGREGLEEGRSDKEGSGGQMDIYASGQRQPREAVGQAEERPGCLKADGRQQKATEQGDSQGEGACWVRIHGFCVEDVKPQKTPPSQYRMTVTTPGAS